MHRVGLYLVWLLPVLSFIHASSDPAADARCQAAHGPGWEAQLDSTGKAIQCIEISTADDCFPDWLNPHTGKYECCPSGTTLASDATSGVSGCCGSGQVLSVDPSSQTGACCDLGLHWSNDPVSQQGACCQDSYTFNGVQCVSGQSGSSSESSSGSSLGSSAQSQPPPSNVSIPPTTLSTSISSMPSPLPPPTPSSSALPASPSAPIPSSIVQPPPNTSSAPASASTASSPPPPLPTVANSASAIQASASSSTSSASNAIPALPSSSTNTLSTSSATGSQMSVSTLGASLCSMLCPSQPTTPPSAFPTPGQGISPGSQVPLNPPQSGDSCQMQTSQTNWFNNTCRGLQLRTWNCPDWGTGVPAVEVGTKVMLPVIGQEWPGYRPADLTLFRFPVDTWITITNYNLQSTQGRARVWADNQVLGEMSSLPQPSDSSGYCWDGASFDSCLIAQNTHSRGIFLIPAGSHNVSLEWLEGSRMWYYAIRYDAVCSALTPCQGQELVPFTDFSVAPTDPIFPVSTIYTIPSFNYTDEVLLTLVDAGYAASQWTLYIDGQSAGSLNRPVYLTEDHFMNDAVLSYTDPGHCFSWGAYWRVYLIPSGYHSVSMRVTGGDCATNAGIPWGSYDASYKINEPCCAGS